MKNIILHIFAVIFAIIIVMIIILFWILIIAGVVISSLIELTTKLFISVVVGIPFGIFRYFFIGLDEIPVNAGIIFTVLYPFYRAITGIFYGPIDCYKFFEY